MRIFPWLLVGIAFVICFLPGCGPTLTEEDLGTVIYEAEELPTTGETYPPPRDPLAEMEQEHGEGDGHSHSEG